MSKKLPQIQKITTIVKTKIFEIQEVDLVFSNNEKGTYQRLAPGKLAVMVLPIDGENLLFIKEYSVGSERYELSFCKGGIDKNENPEIAANRELQEEVGFKAEKLTELRALYTNPGYSFGLMHIFVAENLTPCKLEGDEPEPLEVVRIPLNQIDELLQSEDFAEARTLAALFLLKEFLTKNRNS